MAKAAPDATYDAALDHIAASDRMFICSAQPTNYTEASGTYMLAAVTLTPGDGNGDFTVANGDASGRKVTISAQDDVTRDTEGDATHVALGLSSDTSLRWVTTCTTQTLSATFDTPAFDIEIADPA